MKECTTHHHACDCREEIFRKAEVDRDYWKSRCLAAEKIIFAPYDSSSKDALDKAIEDWQALKSKGGDAVKKS